MREKGAYENMSKQIQVGSVAVGGGALEAILHLTGALR